MKKIKQKFVKSTAVRFMGPSQHSWHSHDGILFTATSLARKITCRGKQFGCSCQREFYGTMPGYPNHTRIALLQLSEVSKKQNSKARWSEGDRRNWEPGSRLALVQKSWYFLLFLMDPKQTQDVILDFPPVSSQFERVQLTCLDFQSFPERREVTN